MASANSLRCLVRPAAPIAPRVHPVWVPRALFSTTHALEALPPPGIRMRRKQGPRIIAGFNNKKRRVDTPVKKPNPGERKAFRKRIQLSNNSALPVQGLDALAAGTLADAASIGKMVAIPDEVVDQLRSMEAFKTTQNWGLFRAPHVLVRDETVKLIGKMRSKTEKKEAHRAVLTGENRSGRSVALLQALSYALLNKWVVIHIPEGFELTNGNTDYAPLAGTSPLQFMQPAYCLRLVQTIYKVNKPILEQYKIEKDWSHVNNTPAGITLAELLLNVKEAEFAWPTLLALWTELTLPGRPPVFFGLDGIGQVNKMSEYRDPDYNPVHAHELSLVRLFTDALAGNKPMPNGGAVVTATSNSNVHLHPSQELVLSQLEAGQAGLAIPQPEPYKKGYENRVYDVLKDTEVVRMNGLSKTETQALMDYWVASGMVRGHVDSHFVSERWALAGHGNVGEMERACLLQMRL